MRSLRLHAPQDLRMHEEPVPGPGPGEVRVRVRSVGMCASDLHYYREGRIGATVVNEPIVLGHEASGVIDAVGDGVTSLSVGDPVALEPAKPCMECEYCKSGHYNVCPDIPFFGAPPTDGALRDYLVWPARLMVKAPESLSFDEIAMVEPLSIGVYAAELAQAKQSDAVAVLGAGAIGLSVLQALKIAGVERVIVTEPIPRRRDMALKLGASEAVDSADGVARISELTDGKGADIVIECTGEEDAVRDACRMARIMGKVVVAGIPDGDDYPFEASAARRKQLSAVFVRRGNLTTEKAIHWVAEGKADVACYATHRFPLEQTADAMELAISKADGVIRSVVVVSE